MKNVDVKQERHKYRLCVSATLGSEKQDLLSAINPSIPNNFSANFYIVILITLPV